MLKFYFCSFFYSTSGERRPTSSPRTRLTTWRLLCRRLPHVVGRCLHQRHWPLGEAKSRLANIYVHWYLSLFISLSVHLSIFLYIKFPNPPLLSSPSSHALNCHYCDRTVCNSPVTELESGHCRPKCNQLTLCSISWKLGNNKLL